MQQVRPHHEEPLLDGTAQSVRYGGMLHDRSGQPDDANSQEVQIPKLSSWEVTQQNLQIKLKIKCEKDKKECRTFSESSEEHSIIWRMFMAATMNAATFMGKNFSTIQSVFKNHESLTLKQMFDVTAQLVNNQEEINCLDRILWGKNSWTHSIFDAHKSMYSQILCCVSARSINIPNPTILGRKGLNGSSMRKATETDGNNAEPTEFEWNIFPGFTTLQLCDRISNLLSSLGQSPETFTGRILFMSMFNDISCGTKGNEEECLANVKVVSTFAKKFCIGQWSFIGPGSEKKWYSAEDSSPQGIWDNCPQ